jgi:hypothetical protein
MFDRVFHADWSCDPRKRWLACAERHGDTWKVAAPTPAPNAAELLTLMHRCRRNNCRSLFGFDFPLGLPIAFGRQIEFDGFVRALSEFGGGTWKAFFRVADQPEEISLSRPFHPNTSRRGRRQFHMFAPLGVNSMNELRRECELKTESRLAACSVFWTLGANQVGKAAIDGWQNLVRPALAIGAQLWPFEGRLAKLSDLPGCVVCETYPREAYQHVGVAFRRGLSKRNQTHRRLATEHLSATWAESRGMILSSTAEAQLADGFGPKESGEDPFDAFMGLLSMVEVLSGRRPEAPVPLSPQVTRWEGWILGQVPRDPRNNAISMS